jgi:hypothetical protein
MGHDAVDGEPCPGGDLDLRILGVRRGKPAFVVVLFQVSNHERAVDFGQYDAVVLWDNGFVNEQEGVGRDEGVDHAEPFVLYEQVVPGLPILALIRIQSNKKKFHFALPRSFRSSSR